MNNLEFDYEAPDEFVGTSGTFEFAVFGIVLDNKMEDIDLDVPEEYVGLEGKYKIFEDKIELDFVSSIPLSEVKEVMPDVLVGMIGTYLITKEGVKFDPFKKSTYENLLLAVEYGIMPEVERLLDEGVVLDEKVITLAIKYGQSEIVEFLLDRKTPYDRHVLEQAAENNHPEILKMLLERTDLLDNDETNLEEMQWEIIGAAAENNNVEIVEMLLELKFSIHEDIIYEVVQQGYIDILRLFMKYNIPVSMGEMMKVAVKHNRINIVRFLMEHGASVNEGLVRLAMKEGNKEIAALLNQKMGRKLPTFRRR